MCAHVCIYMEQRGTLLKKKSVKRWQFFQNKAPKIETDHEGIALLLRHSVFK